MEDKILLMVFEHFQEAIDALRARDQARRKEMDALQDRVKRLEENLRTLLNQRPQ